MIMTHMMMMNCSRNRIPHPRGIGEHQYNPGYGSNTNTENNPYKVEEIKQVQKTSNIRPLKTGKETASRQASCGIESSFPFPGRDVLPPWV